MKAYKYHRRTKLEVADIVQDSSLLVAEVYDALQSWVGLGIISSGLRLLSPPPE